MRPIFLKLDVAPEPKLRPRLGKGRTYTPEKTRIAESRIANRATYALGPDFKPLEGPLRVYMAFLVKKPKSRKHDPHPCVRPDLDNYGKLVCDALNGVLWEDDGQICDLQLVKVYSDEESIEIGVTKMN